LLHKLLGKICICQGGFGFDVLIDLQEKLQGNVVGNLLRKFLKFFSLGDLLRNLPRNLLMKHAGNCWRKFHLLFSFSHVLLWEGIQQLLFVKSRCCGIMGITICRDE
jgi:hypothetical protein